MALHFLLQLHAFFFLAFVAFASSCEQEDYWKMKLPKLPMPQAIRDNLLHFNDMSIMGHEGSYGMNQPWTVGSWKYNADNTKEKENEEVKPLNVPSQEKVGMNQPWTVFSWKYNADNTKEKENEEVKPLNVPSREKVGMNQPWTVFSWKYNADKTKEKENEEVKPLNVPSQEKVGMNQPWTVFSWKYNADNTKEKENEEVKPLNVPSQKKVGMNQPWTVFSWKYNADNVKWKENGEAKPLNNVASQEKNGMNQPFTVFGWKYNVDSTIRKGNKKFEPQPWTVNAWRYDEKNPIKTSNHKQPHDHHFMHNNHVDSNDGTQQEDLAGGSVFFVEKSLLPGMKLKHDFQKTGKRPYLPKHVVRSIPFSLDKFTEILNLFSAKYESAEAMSIKGTLDICLLRPKVKKENRTCAQSMEDVVDFVVGELGTNDVELRMMNDNIEVPNGIQDYVLTKVKKLVVPGNTAVACHRMSYPYNVYYCHHQQDIGQYAVTLVSPTYGTAIQTTAVCHYDTYAWQPDVPALRYLRIRPGDAPVCHFSAINDMFWALKSGFKSLVMAR